MSSPVVLVHWSGVPRGAKLPPGHLFACGMVLHSIPPGHWHISGSARRFSDKPFDLGRFRRCRRCLRAAQAVTP